MVICAAMERRVDGDFVGQEYAPALIVRQVAEAGVSDVCQPVQLSLNHLARRPATVEVERNAAQIVNVLRAAFPIARKGTGHEVATVLLARPPSLLDWIVPVERVI